MEPAVQARPRIRSIDGLPRRQSFVRPTTHHRTPAPAQQPVVGATTKKGQIDTKTGLVDVGGLLFGATIFTLQPIAEIIICLFGAIAFAKRIPSRTIFSLAVIALAVVPIAEVIGRFNVALAFSSYAFLLLAIATVCLGRELRKTSSQA